MEIIQVKKKICMLGHFGVGKTSLTERFVYNRFEEKYLTTIGVKISQKLLPPVYCKSKEKKIQYEFLIWDIASLDKFDVMVKNYYLGAAGALAICDLTRIETSEALLDISQKFLEISPNSKLLFIGNKVDIADDAHLERKRLQEMAEQFHSDFLFTSAKTGEQVEAAFLRLAEQLY